MEPITVLLVILAGSWVAKKTGFVGGKVIEANPSPTGSYLTITSDRPNSRVFVNGVTVGGPGRYSVQAGTFPVRVESAGFKTWRSNVTIASNEEKTVSAYLKPENLTVGVEDNSPIAIVSFRGKGKAKTVMPTTVTIVYEPGAYFRRVMQNEKERMLGGPMQIVVGRPPRAGTSLESHQTLSVTRNIMTMFGGGGKRSETDVAALTVGERNAYLNATSQSAVLDPSAQGRSPIPASQFLVGGTSDSTSFVMQGASVTIHNGMITGGIDEDIGVKQNNAEQNTVIICEPPPEKEMRIDGSSGFYWARVAKGDFVRLALNPGAR